MSDIDLPQPILDSALSWLMQSTIRADRKGYFRGSDDSPVLIDAMMELCDQMDDLFFHDFPPRERSAARHRVLEAAMHICELTMAQIRPTLEPAEAWAGG